MSIVVGQALTHPAQHHLPKTQENEEFGDKKANSRQNGDMGGWSFLQSLCDNTGIARSRGDNTECTEKVYVHPLVKRSASKLSTKSLEMCTESLGCESGSESGDDISLLALEATAPLTSPSKLREDNSASKKLTTISRSTSFPPPLKSVSGSKYGHMVRSYREDGRLVVQAIRVCSPPRCFVADRSQGRLRLCFSEGSSLSYDDDEEHEEDEFNVETHEDEEEDKEDENEEEEEEEEEEEDEEEEGNGDEEEGIEGNNENFEGKTGTRKFRRPSSRCKESGHEQKALLDWKQQQFWVAT